MYDCDLVIKLWLSIKCILFKMIFIYVVCGLLDKNYFCRCWLVVVFGRKCWLVCWGMFGCGLYFCVCCGGCCSFLVDCCLVCWRVGCRVGIWGSIVGKCLLSGWCWWFCCVICLLWIVLGGSSCGMMGCFSVLLFLLVLFLFCLGVLFGGIVVFFRWLVMCIVVEVCFLFLYYSLRLLVCLYLILLFVS